MKNFETDKKMIHMLLVRLERISVDSFWAHRASGIRGALIKALEKPEEGENEQVSEVERIMEMGFFILEQAAKEKT